MSPQLPCTGWRRVDPTNNNPISSEFISVTVPDFVFQSQAAANDLLKGIPLVF